MDEPQQCQQLVLAFIGKFISTNVASELNWLEAETLRFARRLLRPFTPAELTAHLRVTVRHARRILNSLVELQLIIIANGQRRLKTFMIKM